MYIVGKKVLLGDIDLRLGKVLKDASAKVENGVVYVAATDSEGEQYWKKASDFVSEGEAYKKMLKELLHKMSEIHGFVPGLSKTSLKLLIDVIVYNEYEKYDKIPEDLK